jgi:hypothetical protein
MDHPSFQLYIYELALSFHNLMSKNVDPQDVMNSVDYWFSERFDKVCALSNPWYRSLILTPQDMKDHFSHIRIGVMSQELTSSVLRDHYDFKFVVADKLKPPCEKLIELKKSISISQQQYYNLHWITGLLVCLTWFKFEKYVSHYSRLIVEEYGTRFICVLVSKDQKEIPEFTADDDEVKASFYYVTAEQIRSIIVPFLATHIPRSPIDVYLANLHSTVHEIAHEIQGLVNSNGRNDGSKEEEEEEKEEEEEDEIDDKPAFNIKDLHVADGFLNTKLVQCKYEIDSKFTQELTELSGDEEQDNEDIVSLSSDNTVMPTVESVKNQLRQKCIVKLYEKLADNGDVSIVDAVCKLESLA